ncbi:MAG: HAD family phosphatase [Syntrophaceae bacterium]
MIKAILWDNDGVLLDTEILFFEVTKSAFLRLGLDLTEEVWGCEYLGRGQRSRDIALSLGGDPDCFSSVMDERNALYSRILEQPPPVRPLVRETLSVLFGKVKMAIVTGSHREQFLTMHKSNGLLDFFDTIITGDDYTHSKPHPEPYVTAMKELDVTAEQCIAVEDSPRGLASATSAGIRCIIVPTRLTQMLEFPNALSIEQDVSGVLKYVE